MKTITSLTVGIAAVMLVGVLPCAAGGGGMRKMYFEQQEQAIQKIMTCFLTDAGNRDYAEGLYSLVNAESALMAYSISYRDPRLYSRLAAGLDKAAPEVFAYRLFMARLHALEGNSFGQPKKSFNNISINKKSGIKRLTEQPAFDPRFIEIQ